MLTQQRQIITLHDQETMLSRPASEVDIALTMAESLAAATGGFPIEDLTYIEKAACDYAAECMKTALLEMAFQVREKGTLIGSPGPSGSDSWEARLAFEDHKEMVLMLTNPEKAGAFCLVINVDAVATASAAEALAALWEERRQVLLAEGKSEMDVIMDSILGGRNSEDPHHIRIAEIESDPHQYLQVGSEHNLDAVRGYALRLPKSGWNGHGRAGNPSGVERASELGLLQNKSERSGWAPGHCLTLTPQRRYDEAEGYLWPSAGRDGLMPSILMEIVSDIIRTNGLDGTIPDRAAAAATKSGVSWGSGNTCPLQELGYAAVHGAGGVFDASVTALIREYSARVAAHCLSDHLDDLTRLGERLIEAGYGDPGKRFDANDLRDQAFAEMGDRGQLTLFNRTDNGSYRLDLMRDDEGSVISAHAWRVIDGSTDRCVGRFLRSEDRLEHDYDGALTGSEPIEYTLRNIRDMNGILLSLTSVACVFEEEHPARGSDASEMEPG